MSKPTLGAGAAAVFFALPQAVLAQIDYIKDDNTTNLNQLASWVVDDGLGGFASPSVAPPNSTASTDSWTWNNRLATAGGTVSTGNNIGTKIIRVVDPAFPIVINGTHTITIPNGGSIDLSAATQDLTMNNGFIRLAASNATYTIDVAADRTFAVGASTVMNVRNNSVGGKVVFNGEGRKLINGDFQPSNAEINAGRVVFGRSTGNGLIAGGTVTVNGGEFLVSNLSGAATANAPVSVLGGKLGGTGIITAPVTVATAAAIAPGIDGAGNLTLATLQMDAGSRFDFEFTNTVEHDAVTVTTPDGLVLNGATLSLRTTGTNDVYPGNGTYNIIGYSGVLGGGGLTGLTVDPSSQLAGKSYGLAESGGFVTLTISSAGGSTAFWNVDASSAWTTASNWTGGVVPNAASISAGFGGGGTPITAPRTVTVTGTQTVGTLSFNSPQSFTLSGTGAISLDDGASAGSLTDAAGSHTVNVPLSLPNAGAVATVTGAADTLTLGGIVAGNGGLAKAGPGTLVLSADNAYLGQTTIGGGTVQLGAGGASGSVAGPIGNSGQLVINRSDAALALTQGISGNGSVRLVGTGTVEMTVPNTYTGNTTVTNGTLIVQNDLALQGSTLDYLDGGGTLVLGSSLAELKLGGLSGDKDLSLLNDFLAPIPLEVGSNGQSTVYSGDLTSAGSVVTKRGTGTLTLQGANATDGNVVVAQGILRMDGGSLNAASVSTVNAGGGQFVLDGGVLTATANSVFAGGTNGLLVNRGEAAFDGGLSSENGSATNHIIKVTGGSVTASSITLGRSSLIYTAEPTGGSTTSGLHIANGSVSVAGDLNVGTSAQANSSANVRIDGGSLSVGGAVTVGLNNGDRWSVLDVNGGTFTASSPSGVVLGALNAGRQIFFVRGGEATVERIQFGQDNIAGTSVFRLNGGTLWLGAGGMELSPFPEPSFVATVNLDQGTLAAMAPWSTGLPVVLGNAATIQTADQSASPQDITFFGPVTGVGGFLKTGGGTLTLEGDVSHSGLTTVAAGTLLVHGLGDFAFGGVIVDAGATLGGRGTLGSAVSVSAGGIISPGAPDEVSPFQIGALSLSGTLSVDADATTSDRLVSTDAIVLEPSSVLDLTGASLSAASYTIASGASVTGTFGTVNGLPGGYTVQYGATDIRVVSTSGTPYTQWAASFGLTGAAADATADPDGDGFANAVEFALGGSPISGTSRPRLVPGVATLSGTPALTVAVSVRTGASFVQAGTRQRASVDGATVDIEGSNDLTDWTQVTLSALSPAEAAAVTATLPAPPAGTTWHVFRTDGSTSSDREDFVRVRVSL